MGAYILWNQLVPAPPQAISIVEQLLHRQLGHSARSLVAMVPKLPPPDPSATPRIPDEGATGEPGTADEAG